MTRRGGDFIFGNVYGILRVSPSPRLLYLNNSAFGSR